MNRAYAQDKIFESVVYSSNSLFASSIEFKEVFESVISKDKDELTKLIEKLDKIITHLESDRSDIDQYMALKLLVAQDLRGISRSIKDIEITDPEKQLEFFYDKFKKEFGKLGFKRDMPKYFMVKKLPEPYDFDSSGVVFDALDEKEYGVPAGAYLREDLLNPVFTYKTLGHEFVHLLISEGEGYGYPYYLEEGICDFMGSYYMLLKILPREVVYNLLAHSRMNYNVHETVNYTDGVRLASLIYREVGLKGIVYLMKKGRNKMEKIERLAFKGEIGGIGIPRGNWDERLDKFANFCISFPMHLAFSPLAVYAAQKLKEGMNDRGLIDMGFADKSAKEAINELKTRGPVLFAYGEVVSDQSKRFLEHKVMRYTIPYKLAEKLKKELKENLR